MRILLALALLLLAGCPSKQELKGTNAQPAKRPNPAMRALTTKLTRPYPHKLIQYDEFPPEAAAYLEASLNDLMSGGVYAPKDMILSYVGLLPSSQIGRDAILREVEISGEMLAPALISAYMAVDPENCLKYIQRQVNAGQLSYLAAIGPDVEVGKWLHEHVNIKPVNPDFDPLLLERIIGWKLDPTPYLPNIHAMVTSEDPVNSVKAAGFLVSVGLATLEEKQFIIDSLKEDDLTKFSGAIEAIKLIQDPAFVDELVPVIAVADLGELDSEAVPDMKVAFAAYGLTSMGGEQAKLLRISLLESTSPMIRIEAAMGELLQGDPSHWNKFIASGDFSDLDMLAALKPPDAWHLDLLPYYVDFADNETLNNRIIVADNMFRYKDYPDNKSVKQILLKLIDDEEPIVRERAWITAALLSDKSYLDKALEVLQDEDEHPKVRLAAAICAMRPTIDRINGQN